MDTSTSPNSSRYFQQLGKIELEGSSAFLDAQQGYLRENKVCGFIEIQVSHAVQVILLFAPGALAGAYLLEEEDSKPLQIINLPTIWNGRQTPIRTVELPQTAARMMWLALEAPISGGLEIADRQDFEKQLSMRKSENFSGVIESLSEKTLGIFYVHEGNALDSEAFFYDGAEFTRGFAPHAQDDSARRIISHKPISASQSFQCLALRQGVLHWGNATLGRYKDMVGQKMVKMMQEHIKQAAAPWDWQIFIENFALHDGHFFSYAQTAAQAYRAVFMEIGSEMEQVIGGALTRRILTETFDALSKDMRMPLELHRLIPAAFSE